MTALLWGTIAAAAPGEDVSPRAASKPLQQLMQNCDAHKFETIVEATVDGQPHRSKVKLCGNEGQSDAEWIGTLKDAIAKLNANLDMDPAVRTQIVAAISKEIARLQIPQDGGAARTATQPLAPAVDSASSDYAALPPLPSAPPPPPHLLAPAPAVVGTAASSSASLPALAGPPPELSFACYAPEDIGGESECSGFERDTMLTVRAGANVPAGTSLRFVRNGEPHGEVSLAQLRRGQSVRLALPRELCAGFGSGRLDLQVVENGAEVKSEGPFALRC
jgi:hypothetical protein